MVGEYKQLRNMFYSVPAVSYKLKFLFYIKINMLLFQIRSHIMISKANYTFKTTPGKDQKFEMECFYVNQNTKILESISASSQSTPRHLKKHFGFIDSVTVIDSDTLEIENKEGERIQLSAARLTPLIDRDDSPMKKTLLCVKNRGCQAIVGALSEVIVKFKSILREATECEHKSIETARTESDDSSQTLTSCSLLDKNSQKSTLSQGTAKTNDEEGESSVELSKSEDKISKTFSVKISKEDQLYKSKADLNENGVDTSPEEGMDDEEESISILDTIEEIVKKARYLPISFDSITIPKQLQINRELVNTLKGLLQHTPDKTQCFVGLVSEVDENGKRVGDYKIWVNVELFLAKLELEIESAPEDVTKQIFAVVHTVTADSDVDPDVVGVFLNKNSIEFSSKLHQKMTYQDLCRMSCVTLNADNSQRSKDYLKSTLRSFSKGNKNSSMFIKLASQSSKFLNMFEHFLRLYEEGSLFGQGLSLQHLTDNRSKKDKDRLEVPLSLLRLHLKVIPEVRDVMLTQLLDKKMTFSDYRIALVKKSKLVDVKSKVENIAGQPFEVIKGSHPDMMSDDMLEDFSEAKTLASGQNAHYSNLVKHVNLVVNGKDTPELEPPPMFDFVDADKITLLEVSSKLKEHDIGVLSFGGDKDFIGTYIYAWNEHIIKNSGTGVFIASDENDLRSEMSTWFNVETDILVEYVYMKLKRPVQVGGFVKDFCPVAVVGRKELFKDKQIKTFHHSESRVALPILLGSLLDAKSKVLFAFGTVGEAIDIDPVGSLLKREISVTYLARKEVLEPFVLKIKSKVV